MEAASKESGKPFELVVYPEAYHGWAVGTVGYAADSWQRTAKMLSQYQPLR
jgi:dienelactone hydrolase